jgi:N-acetyl-anhydromuramyl-L-alanine amidase AmpD
MNIVFKGSPNFDTNRKPVDKVVIHWFGEGTLTSANSRFQNPESKVSAHYGISDNTIWQWVKEENVAYHAGNYTMNQQSVGIEHDATTTKNASEETYRTSGMLVGDICRRYKIPIDREHIIKHSEVKATQCPGTLDLDKIIAIAKGNSMADDEMVIKKSEYEQLIEAKSYYQQFKDNGFATVTEVKQRIDDLNKAIEEKNKQIVAEKNRAEEYRKDYNDLLAYCAKALNTQQELNQVHTGLDKISGQLDELDELQKNFAALQLAAGKTEEELKAEIAKLKSLLKQENVLENVELSDLIKELIRRLTNLVKRR